MQPVTVHPHIVLFLLAFAHLILASDFTIVYVALPAIGHELGFSSASLQWIVHAYTVMFGGFLLLGGRASDIVGARRVFMFGLLVFGIASAAGGASSSAAAVVIARAMQGLGAACIFPSTLNQVKKLFSDEAQSNRAVAIWSAAGPAGLATGSVLGGLLIETLGWPAVFFINAPLSLLVVVAAMVMMPKDSPVRRSRSFDIFGAGCVTVGVALLLFVLVQGPSTGWTNTSVSIAATLSAFFLIVFYYVEKLGDDPLMPLRLLRNRDLLGGTALTGIMMGTFMALPYFQTILFQEVFGFSAMQTGFAFLAPCISQALGARASVPFVARLGVRVTAAGGLVLGAVGLALLAVSTAPGNPYPMLLPGLIMGSFGQGIAWSSAWIQISTSTKRDEEGIAAAIASTGFQIGGAIGLAVLAAIASVIDGHGDMAPPQETVFDTRLVTVCAAIGVGLGLLVIVGSQRRKAKAVLNEG